LLAIASGDEAVHVRARMERFLRGPRKGDPRSAKPSPRQATAVLPNTLRWNPASTRRQFPWHDRTPTCFRKAGQVGGKCETLRQRSWITRDCAERAQLTVTART